MQSPNPTKRSSKWRSAEPWSLFKHSRGKLYSLRSWKGPGSEMWPGALSNSVLPCQRRMHSLP